MKKFFTLALCAVWLLPFALTACGKKSDTALKLGIGVYATAKATDATADGDGKGQAVLTGAALLIDESGRIVQCRLDCADHTASYTADGKAIATDSFSTKYEMGTDYGMKAYGGAAKEWFEQADAFCELVKGKTLAEVMALVASDRKGTDEVIRAGCTVTVSEFVKAIEKAFANAKETDAAASDTLRLGISTAQTVRDATADAAGQNQLETTFFAAAIGADGRITAAYSDCAEINFKFDESGVSASKGETAVTTKRDAGPDYGMKTYGGAAKEWFEQADAFDKACIGKQPGEIPTLLRDNGYGVSGLQQAGCTIRVSEFAKAAAKIG